jgi:antitoxin (DNA-binding transcriptional repressor) of toxin-antitoxin stability system
MPKRVHRVGIHEAKTHLSRLLHEVERFAGQLTGDDFDGDCDELADVFGIPR